METNRPYAEVYTKNGNSFITKRLWLTDLDEPGIQGDDVFKGFSTGEVYLSVWAEEYLGDKFHFEILDIYGTSFSNLSPQKNFITDEKAPALKLKKTLPNVLYAKVGENIVLPEVVAYDVHLKEVSSTVFYLKGTNLQRLVSVKNNTFVPSVAGVYTVTYIATDTFGNSQTLEIQINAIADDVLAAAEFLLGTHDFSCFEKVGGNNKTSICTITEAGWSHYKPTHAELMGMPYEDGDYIVFHIKADRFLRNMVRAIVGTLIEVGRGKKEPSWIEELTASGTRSDAGQSVPGNALFFCGAEYQENR